MSLKSKAIRIFMQLPVRLVKVGEYSVEWQKEFVLEIWQYFAGTANMFYSFSLGIFPDVFYW